jgi:hypothetical protein
VDVLRGGIHYPNALSKATVWWVAHVAPIVGKPTKITEATWGFDHAATEWAPRPCVVTTQECEIPNICVIAHEKTAPFMHVATCIDWTPARYDEGLVDASTDDGAAFRQEELLVVVVATSL